MRTLRRQLAVSAVVMTIVTPLWLIFSGYPFWPGILSAGIAWSFFWSWFSLKRFDGGYRKELRKAANRYLKITDMRDNELYDFAAKISEGVENGLPLMKLNRWLGNLQGKLAERGYTTDQIERDITRPWFKHLDFGNKWGLWS